MAAPTTSHSDTSKCNLHTVIIPTNVSAKQLVLHEHSSDTASLKLHAVMQWVRWQPNISATHLSHVNQHAQVPDLLHKLLSDKTIYIQLGIWYFTGTLLQLLGQTHLTVYLYITFPGYKGNFVCDLRKFTVLDSAAWSQGPVDKQPHTDCYQPTINTPKIITPTFLS